MKNVHVQKEKKKHKRERDQLQSLILGLDPFFDSVHTYTCFALAIWTTMAGTLSHYLKKSYLEAGRGQLRTFPHPA
jgi:hypothetical protein